MAPESSLKVTDNYRSLSEGFYPLKREERDLYEQVPLCTLLTILIGNTRRRKNLEEI